MARPQTVGRGFISLPGSAFDVVHVVRQTLTAVIKQIKAGTEQDAKKWFSLSESHVYSPDDSFADMQRQKQGEMEWFEAEVILDDSQNISLSKASCSLKVE